LSTYTTTLTLSDCFDSLSITNLTRIIELTALFRSFHFEHNISSFYIGTNKPWDSSGSDFISDDSSFQEFEEKMELFKIQMKRLATQYYEYILSEKSNDASKGNEEFFNRKIDDNEIIRMINRLVEQKLEEWESEYLANNPLPSIGELTDVLGASIGRMMKQSIDEAGDKLTAMMSNALDNLNPFKSNKGDTKK
jgi:hypothetical protein